MRTFRFNHKGQNYKVSCKDAYEYHDLESVYRHDGSESVMFLLKKWNKSIVRENIMAKKETKKQEIKKEETMKRITCEKGSNFWTIMLTLSSERVVRMWYRPSNKTLTLDFSLLKDKQWNKFTAILNKYGYKYSYDKHVVNLPNTTVEGLRVVTRWFLK